MRVCMCVYVCMYVRMYVCMHVPVKIRNRLLSVTCQQYFLMSSRHLGLDHSAQNASYLIVYITVNITTLLCNTEGARTHLFLLLFGKQHQPASQCTVRVALVDDKGHPVDDCGRHCQRAHKHTYVHGCMHTCTLTLIDRCTRAHMQNTYTHSLTHTHTHTNTHRQTHTHTLMVDVIQLYDYIALQYYGHFIWLSTTWEYVGYTGVLIFKYPD